MRMLATPIVLLAAALLLPAQGAMAQGRVVRVTAAEAERRAVEVTEWAVGIIESRFAPQVSAQVSGEVVKLYVDEGAAVEAGAPLADIASQEYRLERTAAEADVQRLQALLDNEQRALARARELFRDNLVSADALDQAESQLKARQGELAGAEARLADSERLLGKTRLLAPVRSQVATRQIDVGDYVQTGTVAFDLVDVENLRVRLPFPEYQAPRLRTGLPVRLSSAASDQTVSADISEVRPDVNPANRAITVIVDFANPGSWRPGASVRAEVVLEVRPDALLVPQVAVVRRPAGDVVYVIEDGVARERPVRRGERNGAFVEILDGLAPGERVAVDGAGFLTNGAAVEIAEG